MRSSILCCIRSIYLFIINYLYSSIVYIFFLERQILTSYSDAFLPSSLFFYRDYFLVLFINFFKLMANCFFVNINLKKQGYVPTFHPVFLPLFRPNIFSSMI